MTEEQVHRGLLEVMGWKFEADKEYIRVARKWVSPDGQHGLFAPPLDHNLIQQAEERLLTTDGLWISYATELVFKQPFGGRFMWQDFKWYRQAPAVVLGECLLKAIRWVVAQVKPPSVEERLAALERAVGELKLKAAKLPSFAPPEGGYRV